MEKQWKWVMAVALVLFLTFGNVGSALAQPGTMVEVLIGFNRPATTADEDTVRHRGGIVKHRYHLVPAIAARVPEKALRMLRLLKRVDYVELDGQVEAIEQTIPWGVDRIDADIVHPYNQGSGVKVAIIDTGIDLDHDDLNVAGDVTFVSGTSNGDDDHGHGTHCAGIVAALDNDTGVIGVAPQVELYAVKVLNSSGSGWWSGVISGIEWAVDHNMDIISMSLGSSGSSYSLEQACNSAYNAGVLVVGAAGNSDYSSWRSTVVYPAKYDSVIAVGATDSSDNRASFSSTGAEVELAAPGADIYSTYFNNSYETMSGTSMACPHVAGTAVLVIASGITDDNSNGRINDEVRLRLQQTADDLGDPGRDIEFGYGLVDADEAAAPPTNSPPVADAGEDQTVVVNNEVTLDGSGSHDPEGELLTYSWTQTAGTEVILSDNTAVSPTFTPTEADTYKFNLVVNDGEYDSPPDEVVITVKAENSPPGAPTVDVTPNSPLTTDDLVCIASSTDDDGDPITYAYAWYKNDTPQPGLTGSTVPSSNTAKGEEWRCEVTPNDGTEDGPSGSDQVTIGNSAPVADAGKDQTVMVDTEVTLDGSGSDDPDGEPLTYSWTQTAGTEVILSDNTAVSPTFTPTEADTYTFELVVNDGSDTDSDTVSVFVTEAPILVMHVYSIDMTLVQRYGGWRTYTQATITIVDPYENPVAGVRVSGHWEDATSDTDSRTTNSSGQVTLRSNSLRRPPTGTTFTFVVDDVARDSWTYDAAANNEVSDSISVP